MTVPSGTWGSIALAELLNPTLFLRTGFIHLLSRHLNTASKAAIAESASNEGVLGIALVGVVVGFAVVAAGVYGAVVGFAVVGAGVCQALVSNTNPLSEPPFP